MKKVLIVASVFIISQVFVSCFRNKVEIIKDLDYSDMKIINSGSISQEKKLSQNYNDFIPGVWYCFDDDVIWSALNFYNQNNKCIFTKKDNITTYKGNYEFYDANILLTEEKVWIEFIDGETIRFHSDQNYADFKGGEGQSINSINGTWESISSKTLTLTIKKEENYFILYDTNLSKKYTFPYTSSSATILTCNMYEFQIGMVDHSTNAKYSFILTKEDDKTLKLFHNTYTKENRFSN